MEAILEGIHQFACKLNRRNREELYKISQIIEIAQSNAEISDDPTSHPEPNQKKAEKKEEKNDADSQTR